tara:strand:- start:1393 stop:1638 length:246 start_codon:yes stop_codon:yes gene_type:complete
MTKDSIYRPIYKRRQKRLNLGYNYKDNIMKNTLSSQMFDVNPTLNKFIKSLNDVVYNWVESVKQIKIFANPALEKYEKDLN